jgi:uncharacterized membrane protein
MTPKSTPTTEPPPTTEPAPAAEPDRAARLIRAHGWHTHPSVRSKQQLTRGERAADRMRNGLGSWGFVFIALVFLAIWMLVNGLRGHSSFDPYPFILLNLVLSCLAAMQGAILLIAAKRSDQIASELAQHDYETDSKAEHLVESLSTQLGELHREHREMQAEMKTLIARLATTDK